MSVPAWLPAVRWPLLAKLLALVLLIAAANLMSEWIAELLRFELRPSNEAYVHTAIMTSAAAYTLLIAMPFVPGVEIGLTLIAMFGPPIVFLVYVSTLAGLSISFAAGRMVAPAALMRLLGDLRLTRARQLLAAIEPMTMQDRLSFLVERAPHRAIPFLLRHRYIALALLINLPGNIVIGGGGGIALMAGASRLYSVPGFAITIALAVSPLPLAVLLFGADAMPL